MSPTRTVAILGIASLAVPWVVYAGGYYVEVVWPLFSITSSGYGVQFFTVFQYYGLFLLVGITSFLLVLVGSFFLLTRPDLYRKGSAIMAIAPIISLSLMPYSLFAYGLRPIPIGLLLALFASLKGIRLSREQVQLTIAQKRALATSSQLLSQGLMPGTESAAEKRSMETPTTTDALKGRGQKRLFYGFVSILAGGLITLFTFSSPSSPFVIVAYGPILYGIANVIRGLIDIAKSTPDDFSENPVPEAQGPTRLLSEQSRKSTSDRLQGLGPEQTIPTRELVCPRCSTKLVRDSGTGELVCISCGFIGPRTESRDSPV